VVGEFSVRVDFSTRAIDIACARCGATSSVDLTEPGFARLLALFASNHRHTTAAPVSSLTVVPEH
jgi:hypothetical protein